MNRPFVSIVIPACNEERRLPGTLDALLAFTASCPFSADLLVVENGSTDGTSEVVLAYAKRHPEVRLLHSGPGKGAAVRVGMLAGTGDYLFACDADLSMPVEEMPKFLPPRLTDFDVAIASREIAGARRLGEPVYRHLMGRAFNTLVRLAVLPQFQDTQCGFKCFRHEAARAVFSRLTLTGWAFDVEALTIARQFGYRIAEVPIVWHFDKDSRIRPGRDTWRMFRDTLRVRRNLRRGCYAPPS